MIGRLFAKQGIGVIDLDLAHLGVAAAALERGQARAGAEEPYQASGENDEWERDAKAEDRDKGGGGDGDHRPVLQRP